MTLIQIETGVPQRISFITVPAGQDVYDKAHNNY